MSDILVIKCNYKLSDRDYAFVRKSFINQKKQGVVVIPFGYEAIFVPDDVKIKVESNEERIFNIVKSQLENGCICFSDTHNKKEMDFIRKLVDRYEKEK